MKYLILSLMVFTSFQAFSFFGFPKDCNIKNFHRFIKSETKTKKLFKNTGSGCNLNGAYLEGADLKGAYLFKANLRGANLKRANLRGADLYKADLNGAYLNRADLNGADLRGADLTQAVVIHPQGIIPTKLRGAKLNGANLTGAYFPKVYRHLLTPKQQKQVGHFVYTPSSN